MQTYEKIITVSAIVMVLGCLAHGGPTNLKNEKALAQRHAEVMKVADPDAGVTYAAIKQDMLDVGTSLDAVSSALDAIDCTVTGPMGVAIAATTGVNKTALLEVRKVLADLKTATKDLKAAAKNNMQATNKMVRKLKESERIEKEAGAK